MNQQSAAEHATLKTAVPCQPKWHSGTDWSLSTIVARPDVPLHELQVQQRQVLDEKLCLQTICNARRALEQTQKTLIAQRQDRLDVTQRRIQ
jgi:hypothetical protein